MSNGVTLTVIGLPPLIAKLNKPRMIAAPARDYFIEGGARAQERAYQHAAKRTGRMANAIHTAYDTAVPMSFFELIAPVEYSPYQEYGTYKMAAHPFMRPAIDETAPEMAGPLLAQFASAIERGMAI